MHSELATHEKMVNHSCSTIMSPDSYESYPTRLRPRFPGSALGARVHRGLTKGRSYSMTWSLRTRLVAAATPHLPPKHFHNSRERTETVNELVESNLCLQAPGPKVT